jgi:hypothetical protein
LKLDAKQDCADLSGSGRDWRTSTTEQQTWVDILNVDKRKFGHQSNGENQKISLPEWSKVRPSRRTWARAKRGADIEEIEKRSKLQKCLKRPTKRPMLNWKKLKLMSPMSAETYSGSCYISADKLAMEQKDQDLTIW